MLAEETSLVKAVRQDTKPLDLQTCSWALTLTALDSSARLLTGSRTLKG